MNDYEDRKQRALARLGTNEPSCVDCNETDWRTLSRGADGLIRCSNHRKQAAQPNAPSTDPVKPHRACVLCRETDIRCLEQHHLAGRKYDATFTVELCTNCHDRLSDAQRAYPASQAGSDTQLQTIGQMLIGLADFLISLVEKLREFGHVLIERANAAVTFQQEATR